MTKYKKTIEKRERLLIKVAFEFASARIHAFIVKAISLSLSVSLCAKSHRTRKPTKATKWLDIENAIKLILP